MSGHSKWASIKHKKGAADAKRGQLFTKLIKEITAAARKGGGNADANPSLRLAVAKAVAAVTPATNAPVPLLPQGEDPDAFGCR